MATRYWVGGSGTWDTTTTTNWSATSGGAGGASAPTSADDVVFNSLSSATAYTVTLTPAAVFTATIAGTVMTVTAVTNGTLAVGQNLSIFGQAPFTVSISSLGTGTGGVGTYNLNVSRTISSQVMNSNPPTCNSFTVAAPLTGAVNFTSAAGSFLNVYGNFILPATNCTINGNINPIYVPSTAVTFATNNIQLGTIQLFGTGSLSFSSAATIIAIYMFSSGFVTNNYTLTGYLVSSQQSDANIIVSLGSSTVNLSSNSGFTLSGGNTLNASTSTINLAGTTPLIGGTGTNPVFTYYNVNFTSTATYSATVYGSNTFNNLTFATVTTASSQTGVSFEQSQTINGTLTMSGASYTQRFIVAINNVSPAKQSITLTVAAISSLSYIDFQGITAAGASAPWSGTSIGDGQNNTNITTTPSKNVYWNYPNAYGNWSPSNGSVVWATSSGGATSVANFPLAQDTCIFDNVGLGTTGTVAYDRNWWLGRLDFSRVTNSATFSMGAYPNFYLDVIFVPSLILLQVAGSAALFNSYGTQTLVSAGLTFPEGVIAGFRNSATSTLTLAGAASTAKTFTLSAGLLNLNNNNITCGVWSSANTNTRAITFGTGQIYVTGNNGFVLNHTITNFTYTGSGIFNATYSGSTGFRGLIFGQTSEANSLNLNVTAGTDQVQVYGDSFRNIDFTGFSGTWIEAGDRTIWGSLTISTGMTITATSQARFYATSGIQTITSNSKTLTFPIFKNGAGTLRLVDALTLGSTLTFTHTAGTVDLNSNNLTCGYVNSNNANTRTLAFGTGQIYVTGNSASTAGQVWNFNTGTGLTITGSAIVNATYSGSVGTRLFLGYAVGSAQINVNITAGTDIVQISNYGFNNVNFTGFTGSVTSGLSVTGNLTLGAGMTITSASSWYMFGTSGTQNITSNAVTIDAPMIFSGTATYQLQDNLTFGSTRAVSLNSGRLNLNGKTLTCGLFFGNVSPVIIDFGSSGIYMTGNNAQVFNNNGAISYTGTPNLYFTYSGSTGTRTISGGATAYPFNYYFTAGSDTISLGSSTFYNTINFTGFSGTLATFTGNIAVKGDFVLSSAMTFTASSGAFILAGSSTQNVTTNGKVVNSIISLQGVNYILQDNLTVNTGYYLETYSGVLNLNGKTATLPAFYANGATTRSIAFGGGTIVINSGGGASVWGASGSNFNTSGSGKISFTAATNKVFNGNGSNYPTISQDGAGILYINGNNTYQDMTATVFPSTIDFGAGGTHSFYNFSVVGTAGNLVTVNSFVPGSAVYFVNLSGHNLGGNYMYLQDINASPANTWYGGRNTTNVSNNTGWVFYNYYPVTAVENATLADAETSLAKFRSSTLDSFTSADTVTLGQALYNVARIETISLLERITTSASFSKSVVEALTVLNAQTGNAKFVVSRTENSTMADAETNVKKLYSAVLENFAPANTQSSIAKYNRSVVENFNPVSIQTNTVQYNSAVIETIVTFDISVLRGWSQVVDSQNPGWTQINNSQ